MKKSDLKDGYIIEIEWSSLHKRTRYIKLGDDFIGSMENGSLKGYALEDDLTINQGLGAISKVTKVFKNRCMTDFNDIKDDNCLTLIWQREREIDWSKVPKWTPVQASDSMEFNGKKLLVKYEPKLKEYPFIVARNFRKEACSYKYCRIHPDIVIKEEWYK